MPSERFISELNEQIGREFAASHQYLAVAAYYEAATFPRLAKFFYKQADEERGHAMRMLNYVIDSGAAPELGQIPAPRREFENHVAPIQLGLEQERSNTVEIDKLFASARETNDHASEVFLQWFIDEQTEEEATMESLLEVAERVREFPMMLEEFLARDGDQLGSARGG